MQSFNNDRESSFSRRTHNSSSSWPSPMRSAMSPKRPLRQYFSRRQSSQIRTKDLPVEKMALGYYTPAGIFFVSIKLTVPLAYFYILLILVRELCEKFPGSLYIPIQTYFPYLASVVSTMQKSSTFVEVWAIIEALFYICLRLHIQWLQYKDPLEASLSSAPMLELWERRQLWERIMEIETDDPVCFVTGWFFDQDLQHITRYDVLDFVAWSMFEGRNQEHLTADELRQLHDFVDELEWKISEHLYRSDTIIPEEDTDKKEVGDNREDNHETPITSEFTQETNDLDLNDGISSPSRDQGDRPRNQFRFPINVDDDSPDFFTNLYENYHTWYEQTKDRLENSDFHPVQGIRNYMAEKRQQIVEKEKNAMATASNMAENAYNILVSPGSNMDKQLTALSHATQSQLMDAWNSMVEMKERLEMAKFVSSKRKALQQQLRGYRHLLDSARAMSSAIPSNQMADLMRKITQCNEAIERVEWSARDAFVKATGYARKNILQRTDPQRYAKYSHDPLLGISTYPLMFHLLILGVTDGGLRVILRRRGFERRTMGPIVYYFHPGSSEDTEDDNKEVDDEDGEITPIVFCHGIGIGLLFYLPLIDEMLRLGRPIFLPEIPYVAGFRPWQSPNCVLPPAVVSSTLTGMLATHGFLRGAFMGHSYGTSWLSYMCKYAPKVMVAAVFLDPICFCLHCPRLTKQFVYHRADPGSISYMVRTDVIINWTIQRSFPWARIALFTEQIPVPSCVFLSDGDQLVPAERAETYLKSKGAPIKDFDHADKAHFATGPLNVTVFRGDGHGDWTERGTPTMKVIIDALDVLCEKHEQKDR